MKTPAQLRLRLAGRMSGDEVGDLVDELLDSGYWLISDLEFSGPEIRVVLSYLPTGEEFTLTAHRVAA
jgi:hypothetical protein